MSDTSPKNQDALTAGYKSATTPRLPRRGDEVWRLGKDGELLTCELLDDSHVGAGWEVALRKDGELIVGRRCRTRAAADDIARVFQEDHRRTGWTVVS